jgi:hypothetical protein
MAKLCSQEKWDLSKKQDGISSKKRVSVKVGIDESALWKRIKLELYIIFR